MTRRTLPAPTADIPVFDLLGVPAPKGTPVRVTAAPHPSGRPGRDPGFTGTLYGVDYRDGVAYTVAVFDGHQVRHVYASRVSVIGSAS